FPKDRYPDGHPHLARSLNNLAGLHQARGEHAKAEPLFREALAMRTALTLRFAADASAADARNLVAPLPLTRHRYLSLPAHPPPRPPVPRPPGGPAPPGAARGNGALGRGGPAPTPRSPASSPASGASATASPTSCGTPAKTPTPTAARSRSSPTRRRTSSADS